MFRLNLLPRVLLTALVVLALAACQPSPQDDISVNPPTDEPSPPDSPTEQPPDQPPAGEQGEVVGAPLARIMEPQASADQLAALQAGNSQFAFDLYHRTAGQSTGNLIFSPYSISLAFAMVYAGARGSTEQQIAEVLHYDLPQDQLHPAFNALDLTLVGTGEEPTSEPQEGEGQPFTLRIANAIWGQRDFSFAEPFLETIALNYGAGLRVLDFENAPEPSRETINRWVADETEDRIQNLIPQGVIDELTRLVLTNAIYFYGPWTTQFEPEATEDAPFTTLDDSQVTVPMMHQPDLGARYAAGDGYQAVELLYGDFAEAAMVIILPDAGRFEEIEGSLDAARFASIRESLMYETVRLWMPRFEFESEFSLKDTLVAMGMTAPFGEGEPADFTGITDAADLEISAVIHKANITVDEEGTEAAAATAIVVAETSAMEPQEPVDMRIDRPFLFAIVDQETGTILFLGRVTNPAE